MLKTFRQELQKRNLLDRIAITYPGCLGRCDQGAARRSLPGGHMYSRFAPQDVAAIFDEHLLDGKPVERLRAPSDVRG